MHVEGETSPTSYLDEFTQNDADIALILLVFYSTLMSGLQQ
jgi:hypothetical protein